MSWMVKQDFPTPPPPTTTSLYSRRNCGEESQGQSLSKRGGTNFPYGLGIESRESTGTGRVGSRGIARDDRMKAHLGGHSEDVYVCKTRKKGGVWKKVGSKIELGPRS